MKFGKRDIFTIPNMLSIFRLILAAVFLWVFYNPEIGNKNHTLTALLIASALSDFLDGKIARRFHMVSELGKVLDPIADKVTQGVLLFCLLSKYKTLKLVFVLFLVKESYMAVAGMNVIRKTRKNDGAMWYGKVNTTVFYTVMILLVFIPDISTKTANWLILLTEPSRNVSSVSPSLVILEKILSFAVYSYPAIFPPFHRK